MGNGVRENGDVKADGTHTHPMMTNRRVHAAGPAGQNRPNLGHTLTLTPTPALSLF